jgi:hypothetical protein
MSSSFRVTLDLLLEVIDLDSTVTGLDLVISFDKALDFLK